MEFYKDSNIKLIHGNMLEELDKLEPNSIDCIITDPPYELGFMGKGWDRSGVSFQKETWEKCNRVLKHGGALLVFGGSRTFHRIACAIEDAGFDIKDTILWIFGSGFPKSMNIGKAIDKKEGNERIKTGKVIHHAQKGVAIAEERGEIGGGSFGVAHDEEETIGMTEWEGWGTQLKPSYEPVIVARKKYDGTIINNVLKHRVGGINIDECRIFGNDIEQLQKNWIDRKAPAEFNGDKSGIYGSGKTDNVEEYTPNGRFPANTILTYDETDFEEVCGGFPNTKSNYEKPNANHTFKGNKEAFTYGYKMRYGSVYEDSGSASRYFYCAKASRKDRDEGLDNFEKKKTTDGCIRSNLETARKFGANSVERRNIHPTVKPTELMQYLIRLVAPPNATILDCFMGSGSTGKAVMYENNERNKNYKFIGVEMNEEYINIAKARILYAKQDKETATKEVSKQEKSMTIMEYMDLLKEKQ